MLVPGTVVDRYTVEHLLGRGGMASVYAVKHRVLGTRHALKVLHTTAPAVHDRLVREGRVQARLDPTTVVPVTDVIDVDGAPALLMPLVEGCSLAELLDDHRPSEAEVAALFRPIVAGVATAHAAGVIHRDLKPANVLLEVKRGVVVVRVADFGLARADGDDGDTGIGAFMGTPAYASPEQLLDAAHIDDRADLWSLGVVLYELLTGRRPFDGPSMGSLLVAVEGGDYDRAPVPDRWRPLLDGLLEPSRDRRTSSVRQVATALAEVCDPAALVVGSPVAEVVRRRIDAATATRSAAERAAGMAETLAPPSANRHNLPGERDAFIGREADLASLHASLADGARLLSVLGIGGTGKTRLVTHYGWQHRQEWPGGVWFCDLSEARSVDGIAYAVARALDVPLGSDDPVVRLGHAIAGRGRCLVVLDNFEQVARHARETLGRWLDRAHEAVFVVTTREVLGLPGERSLALAPLVPVDSVGLFGARARDATAGFAPDADDTAAIDALVALLDHLPLAIELAAARVRVLPPRKLLPRMTDRFRVLTSTGGRHDRQATLKATLDWSWDLLNPWEQAALAQVSVFEGGFDLEAAEAVVDLSGFDEAPWAMDAVQALVDKSLVRTAGDDRFDLLVTVQEYAAERLRASGERGPAEARHGEYYAGFGTPEALASLDVHGGVARRRALARDLDNVVTANRRAVVRRDSAVAASTAVAAWAAMRLTGPFPVLAALLEATLAVPGHDREGRARVHGAAVGVWQSSGKSDRARAHFDVALALAREVGADRGGSLGLEGALLCNLGSLHSEHGRLDEAAANFEAALAVAGDDRRTVGNALRGLGVVHAKKGEMAEARARYEAALAVVREMGNRVNEGIVLGSLGILHAHLGQAEEARSHYEAALAVHREVGDRRSEGHVLGNLGNLSCAWGRIDEGRAHYAAALALAREVGDRRSEGVWVGNLGRRDRDPATARAHLSEALALHREVGFTYGQPYWLAGLALLDARTGRLDTALELALEAVAVGAPHPRVHVPALISLARVHLARSDAPSARETIARARALAPGDANVAVVDALVAVAEGDVAAAEAALAEATADPLRCLPGSEVAELVAEGRAGVDALRAGA